MTIAPTSAAGAGDETLRAHLDEDQAAVAEIVDRNVVVLAPPGSGKTRVLVHAAAHRVRHARELVGYEHARVLCLTFGNDAAREMRSRLEQPPLSVRHQRMWVGNYHGLGAHLLHRYGHLIGWPRDAALLPSPGNESVVAEAIDQLGIKNMVPSNTAFAISALKGRRGDDQNVAERLIDIRERYDQLLAERHLRDFDDLILHALWLLTERPKVAQVVHDSYPFLFVDELQDTNLLQLDLLRQLAGPNTRVFAVADDDQMIYGWRDAHPENIDQFVSTFDATEVALTGNYRCPPRIVAAANQVILLNNRRRAELMESRVEDREGEVIEVIAGSVTEGQAVAIEVQRAVDEGVPLGRIAILAPHKFKFSEVTDALTERGLRYVHPGGDELKGLHVVRLLRLALRCVAGGKVVSGDVTGLFPEADSGDVAARIQALSELVAAGSPRGVLSRLLRELKLGTVHAPMIEPDAIATVASMFRRALDDDVASTPADVASTLLMHWDRLEAAALRAEQAIKLMTSFTAKGTEYQVVLLPFMNKGLVPYARRGSEIDWQESRRVFYVALTRAENRVVLVRSAQADPSELLQAVAPEFSASYEL